MVHSKKEIITIIIKRNSKQAKYMDTWVLWHGNTVNKMVTVVKTRGQMRKTVWCHEQECVCINTEMPIGTLPTRLLKHCL